MSDLPPDLPQKTRPMNNVPIQGNPSQAPPAAGGITYQPNGGGQQQSGVIKQQGILPLPDARIFSASPFTAPTTLPPHLGNPIAQQQRQQQQSYAMHPMWRPAPAAHVAAVSGGNTALAPGSSAVGVPKSMPMPVFHAGP
ncbi:unnamed protein product, partial [Pylaiella littoralis]